MGKALKVDYKGITAKYENYELIATVESLNDEGTESVIDEVNITSEVKELLASLDEEDKIAINIKKYKEPKEKEKQPIFKYVCGCGKEIKSKFEGLDITCNECENTFMMEEGK
jgi:DNA-directed RNA polymerase subunit RPC12/RpoP